MSDKQNTNEIDERLVRVLKDADAARGVSAELLRQMQPTQSAWPWQVPQAPAYTSDGTQ